MNGDVPEIDWAGLCKELLVLLDAIDIEDSKLDRDLLLQSRFELVKLWGLKVEFYK